MTAETFDAVLAEMRNFYADIDFMRPVHQVNNEWADRLAAAHAAEVGALQEVRLRFSARIVTAESRADAATALLRECLQFVPDDLAARIAEMVGRE